MTIHQDGSILFDRVRELTAFIMSAYRYEELATKDSRAEMYERATTEQLAAFRADVKRQRTSWCPDTATHRTVVDVRIQVPVYDDTWVAADIKQLKQHLTRQIAGMVRDVYSAEFLQVVITEAV